MFQEKWVHSKTGACGFNSPFSKHGINHLGNRSRLIILSISAEGFFTAVGSADWENGLACGTCAELEYKGNVITVNVVDKGHGVKGWFDLGGPAWRALTSNQPPGRVFDVKSTWVACPASLTGGNLRLYVKPGSDPWDARFQVILGQSVLDKSLMIFCSQKDIPYQFGPCI